MVDTGVFSGMVFSLGDNVRVVGAGGNTMCGDATTASGRMDTVILW